MTSRCASATMGAVLAISIVGAAQAQDLASARAELTGPTANEWVLTKIEMFMGVGNHCQQGEALRFLATQQVVTESCVAGLMTTRTVPWSLRTNGALDPVLTFNGSDYLLFFHDEGRKHYMRLRRRGADITDLTYDHEYLLSDD